MKAVVAAFNQEKALVGAFSVITNLRMDLFQALVDIPHLVVPDPRPRVVVDPALAAAAVGHDGAVLAGGEHRAVRVRGAAAGSHPPVVRQPEPVSDLHSCELSIKVREDFTDPYLGHGKWEGVIKKL